MHWMFRSSLGFAAAALALASTGCGGSSATPTAAGIWQGTDATNGLLITGFVDSSGAADFIRADGAQFYGQAQVSGNAASFTLQAVSEFGSTFGTGGPTYGSATLHAQLDTQQDMSGTLNFTPNGGTASTAAWSFDFNVIYGDISSLAIVSGNYTDSSAVVADGVDPLLGASVSISSGGQITGQNPNNSCVINGTVALINAQFDMYQVSYTLSSCVDNATASFSALNGVTFSGLASQDPTYNPAHLNMAVSGQDGAGNHYGIVSQLLAD